MASGIPQDRDEGGFLSRWSRRKVQLRQGAVVAEPPVALPSVAAPLARAEPAPALPVTAPRPVIDGQEAAAERAAEAPAAAPTAAPAPTLADVAALTPDSDFSRFVAPGVDHGVKYAALKKLFTAPHFNIMDGLDTYIDDYGTPDPLPEGMLRQMAQSHALGLFADDPPAAPAGDAASMAGASPAQPVSPTPVALTETPPQPSPTPDEDAALRLQPHDAAGPAGPGPGAGPDTGRLD